MVARNRWYKLLVGPDKNGYLDLYVTVAEDGELTYWWGDPENRSHGWELIESEQKSILAEDYERYIKQLPFLRLIQRVGRYRLGISTHVPKGDE